MSLTYFLNDLEMVPVAPVITGITLVFTFHMHCIYIVSSLYFKIFSASFLITFLSPGIAIIIIIIIIIIIMCPVYFPMLFAFLCFAVSVIGHLAVDSVL
jgi:hypothetical protein